MLTTLPITTRTTFAGSQAKPLKAPNTEDIPRDRIYIANLGQLLVSYQFPPNSEKDTRGFIIHFDNFGDYDHAKEAFKGFTDVKNRTEFPEELKPVVNGQPETKGLRLEIDPDTKNPILLKFFTLVPEGQ